MTLEEIQKSYNNVKVINGSKVRYWACINFSRNVQQRTTNAFCQQVVQACQTLVMEFCMEPVIPVYSARPDMVKKALTYVHSTSLNKLDAKELEFVIAILPENNGSFYGSQNHIF